MFIAITELYQIEHSPFKPIKYSLVKKTVICLKGIIPNLQCMTLAVAQLIAEPYTALHIYGSAYIKYIYTLKHTHKQTHTQKYIYIL